MPASPRRLRAVVIVVSSLAVLAGACSAGSSLAPRAQRHLRIPSAVRGQLDTLPGHESGRGESGPEETEMLQAWSAWYYGQRMAPGNAIPAFARLHAFRQAQSILGNGTAPPTGTRTTSAPATRSTGTPAWRALGPQPIDAGDPTYSDPSNGSVYPNGFHEVSGRVTALAVTPGAPNVVYLGAADGGVWKTTDGGQHWAPVGDRFATTSIGAVAIAPRAHQTVFAGTGEANTNGDSYWGAGIYKTTDGGATWTQLGAQVFDRATVFRLIVRRAGKGLVLAATNHGLFRSTNGGSTWTRVLAPGGADLAGDFVTDLVPLYGTKGKGFVSVLGWRYGDSNNGLYRSDDAGKTWTAVDATGFAPQSNIGRVSLATTRADPGLMYAVVQDSQLISAPTYNTLLNGVYRSTSGPEGPWQVVATSQTLASDQNSALSAAKIGPTYQPGIQAWYNQYVVIDPTNPDDVVLGLEEIYDSSDGGQTWQTIGRYWNVCLTDPGPPGCYADPNDHPTTHPDQHAAAFGVQGGKPKLYVGSDGGAWSQVGPSWSNDEWTDLNTAGLSTSQPYFSAASAGPDPVIYAGLQDNGTIKYGGGTTWPEIFGGDGGDVAVEPNKPKHVFEEYVYLDIAKSSDGGKTWTDIEPPDGGSSSTARFIAPFMLDPENSNRIIALGENVWESTKGIGTSSDDWVSLYDNGSGKVGTALDVRGSTIYEGWCGACNPTNPLDPNGAGFASGLASNVGGTWHALTATGLPNRYITGVTMDPANPQHVFVTLSGFSRRFVPYAGTGHVFESTDGGAHFADISANLPDGPADDIVRVNGKLIVATDVGAFVRRSGGTWAVLGSGLPNVAVNDLSVIPGTTTVIATTHGRGVWTIKL
ncbi:MAG TPA: hypothetical protein VGB19_05175 [Actinomycetota bacterium]